MRAQFGESDDEGNIVLDTTTGSRSAADFVDAMEKKMKEDAGTGAASRRGSKEVLLTADMDEDEDGKKKKREAPDVKKSMVAWVIGLSRPELVYVLHGFFMAAAGPAAVDSVGLMPWPPPPPDPLPGLSFLDASAPLSRAPSFPSTLSSLARLLL